MKRSSIAISIIATIAIIAVSITLIVINSNSATSYPGTAFADRYGFDYSPDMLNTWNEDPVGGYNGYHHSGIRYLWSFSNPSVHYTILSSSPVWPGSSYKNSDVWKPKSYLNGNGLFIYSGHGGKHRLYYYNGGAYTYLYDHRNNCPPTLWGSSIFIADSMFGLDYMKLAYLKGCETSKDGTGSLAWWWRCGKGTDNVIGWRDVLYNWQGNEYMEKFIFFGIRLGQPIWMCHAQGISSVLNECEGALGNVDSVEIWGE
ncbi:MAG: hypothetical protein HPY75_07020 [Actinobacteria bacterium]|nr:hypothetical protein [Actinomycetota bacterium]